MFFILGRKLGETENEKYKNGKEKYTSGGSFLTLVCSLERIVEIMLCASGWGMKLSSIIHTGFTYRYVYAYSVLYAYRTFIPFLLEMLCLDFKHISTTPESLTSNLKKL